MNFSRNLIVLSSLVLIATGCSKHGGSAPAQSPAGPNAEVQKLSNVEVKPDSVRFAIASSDQGEKASTAQVQFVGSPANDSKSLSIFMGEISQKGEYPMTSAKQTDEKVTALAFGESVEVVVVVREVPMSGGPASVTGYVFVRDTDGRYLMSQAGSSDSFDGVKKSFAALSDAAQLKSFYDTEIVKAHDVEKAVSAQAPSSTPEEVQPTPEPTPAPQAPEVSNNSKTSNTKNSNNKK
jgi:hypothetical protein